MSGQIVLCRGATFFRPFLASVAVIQPPYQSVAALVPQEEEEAAKDLPQHCRTLEWDLWLAEYRIGL